MEKKTSLSAGIIVGELLSNAIVRKKLANKVFPVVTDKATLPYIRYRRVDLMTNSTKESATADTSVIAVECFTTDYSEGVRLAEVVRDALDHKQARYGNLTMRSCTLVKAGEDFANDAYIQTLIFNVKI